MFKIRLTYILLLLQISCIDRDQTEKIDLQEYGLIESFVGRDDIQAAINDVNAIIGENYISPTWITDNHSSIKIALVQSEGLPYNTIAQCNLDKKIIFVVTDWKEKCKETFEWLFSNSSSSNTSTLAIVLLHELGHIKKLNQSNLSTKKILQINNISKEMMSEVNADFFAAQLISSSKTAQAIKLKMQVHELTVLIKERTFARAFFNGQNYDGLYKDFSNSHPNILLRFILMEYYVNPTANNLWLANTFISMRKK